MELPRICKFIAVTNTWNMTLPVGLATVQTSYGVHYAQIMASAVLGGLPTLIAFLFLTTPDRARLRYIWFER